MNNAIFTSHLDDDVYKFHMGCIFWDKFRGTPATYAYKCRDTSVDLRPIYNDLCEQIEAMSDVTLQRDEQKWLFENTKVTQDYLVNFLAKFHFDPRQVQIKKIDTNPGIEICFDGPIEEVSLWEMPMMYTISELYFRKKYEQGFQKIVDTAKADLSKKIEDFLKVLEQNPKVRFLFSEFGTRRRLCQEFQGWMVKQLKGYFPTQLVGTSNMLFAKTHGLKAVGTLAHEFPMFYQALYHLEDSQKKALEDWIEFYRGWLGIALTDTLGSNKWDRDFTKELMIQYTGQRHDSGDPFQWAEKRLRAYSREGIDPTDKTLLFSDNLTFTKAFDLSSKFGHILNVSHGIGTFLSNHIPSIPEHKALNQIIKIVRANGRPVCKLSDDPMKAQCKDLIFLNYAKHIAE